MVISFKESGSVVTLRVRFWRKSHHEKTELNPQVGQQAFSRVPSSAMLLHTAGGSSLEQTEHLT